MVGTKETSSAQSLPNLQKLVTGGVEAMDVWDRLIKVNHIYMIYMIYLYINLCLLGRALYVVLVVSRMEPQFDPATPPKPIYLNYIYVWLQSLYVVKHVR